MFKFPVFKMNLLDGGSTGGGGGAPEPDGSAPDGVTPDTTSSVPDSTQTQDIVLADFLKDIDPDLKQSKSLASFKNMNDLAKSYVHAQKMIGKNKMVVPSKNSSPEEWREAFNKLGLPNELDKYEVQRKENSLVDDDFFENFKKTAHEAGILPQQTQKLYEMYEGTINDFNTKSQEESKAIMEKEIAGLKEEWGDGFEKNVKYANLAVDELGGEEVRKYLEQKGLLNDVQMTRMLSKMGKAIAEDVLPDSAGLSSGIDPAEAQEAMNNMLSDKNSPIHNRSHANHKTEMEKYNKLSKLAFGIA